MITLQLTPQQLLDYQISHYTNRLKMATGFKEKIFLRNTLSNLRKEPNYLPYNFEQKTENINHKSNYSIL